MVFAIMYYQFSIRNGDSPERKAQLNDISNQHYHWSVQRIYDLASDRSLAAMQALTLICVHCRGFPKPGPVWFISCLTWNKAIELNFHRALLKPGEPTNLENEMRKRTWCSLLMVVVMLYGRLGKPMPIRAEDIDVEFPECVADELLTEDGIIESPSPVEPYWQVASEGFKLAVMFLDMWNDVHAVRQTPKVYVERVHRLEQRCREFQQNLPDELKVEKCKLANQVVATYLEASVWEFLMRLRHPSRCVTTDPTVIMANARVSEDAAKKTLDIGKHLAKLKSLDATWYQMAVYVAAIFALLAHRWERRMETTPKDFAELKEYMNIGLTLVNDIFNMICLYNQAHASIRKTC